jgi:hypothetical protein
MGTTRYFMVWSQYHDSPEDLIDHLGKHGDLIGSPILDEANQPGCLTGSAEIEPSGEGRERK